MKKLFKKIHLWLSVPFGVIITLVCFSGAMLVFEQEVDELCRPELYFAERPQPGAEPLPLSELLENVAGTLPDSVAIASVSVPADPERNYQVSLTKPRRAAVYVDPYTGDVAGRNDRLPFFSAMFRLHRWLLGGASSVGKTVVGVSTLVFVVVLVTGIVLWWPRTAKSLKRGLKISVRKGWRRFLFDLHVAGGMYALVFLLAMALTGLTWSFPWYRSAFYSVFGVETTQQTPHGGPQKPSGRAGGRDGGETHAKKEKRGREAEKRPAFGGWEKALDELKRSNPGYSQITVSDGTATVSDGSLGNRRASDRYSFDARTGKITEASPYGGQDKSGKIRGWIYSVHVGSWGGTATRVIAFIAALIGCALPITGYYLWIKRLRSKPARR